MEPERQSEGTVPAPVRKGWQALLRRRHARKVALIAGLILSLPLAAVALPLPIGIASAPWYPRVIAAVFAAGACALLLALLLLRIESIRAGELRAKHLPSSVIQ
jgi:hypothetical protein